MKMIATALLLAAMAAAPVSAMQKEEKKKGAMPNINAGELVLFEFTDYDGANYVIKSNRPHVKTRWNVSSIAVHPGDSWQVCEKPRYKEPCMVLTAGETDLGEITIGSARPASEME